MRNLRHWSFSLGTLVACTLSMMAYAQLPSTATQNSSAIGAPQTYSNSQSSQPNPTLRIGIVNTKRCLEESKLGKQEQANFEKMKKQMEEILQEKERTLEDIESKLNDDDYLDSVSDEAASELKRKRRSIRNDGMQLQSQYMQTLQQANLKIVQKLTDVISRASTQVAQDPSGQPVDVIYTDEACTFYAPRLDVSDRVIEKMNKIFDAEQKDSSGKPKAP